jgi:phasin family protein
MPTSHHNKATESDKNEDHAHQKKSEHRSGSVADWKKNFVNFKTPVVDVEQLIAHYRRSAETSSAVIQILTESTRIIARRQTEYLCSNIEHALKASKEVLNHSTSKSPASRQADFARSWLDLNVKNLKEITEISTKSMREAFDVINKRVAEQSKEFVDIASSTSHSSEKKAA